MAEHRVPMLGAALRRRRDPARSRDPRVRELVAALARVEPAPAPRPEFRAELRAQLVAVAPRLVAEGAAASADSGDSAAGAPARSARTVSARRHVHVKRPLVAVVGVLVAFVVLLGGAVLLSRNALPGDALYGVKRASENTEYSLTGGAIDKGKLKLDFAARRIGEVSDLLPRADAMAAGRGPVADSGEISAHTGTLVRETLGSADDDIRAAAQMLGAAAVRSSSAAPLAAVTDWTPGQIRAMREIAARIPAGSLHNRALRTEDLIRAAQQRAVALKADLGCGCLTRSGTDDLGPIPCSTGCAPARNRPGSTTPPAKRGPGSSSSAPAPGAPASSTAPGGARTRPRSAAPAQPTGSSGGVRSTAPAPPSGSRSTRPGLPPVPGLPGISTTPSVPTPSLPVNVDSCGVQVTLAGIGIGIGGC